MVDDLMSLSRMSSKFPDFDTTGKRMYIDRVRDRVDKGECFAVGGWCLGDAKRLMDSRPWHDHGKGGYQSMHVCVCVSTFSVLPRDV